MSDKLAKRLNRANSVCLMCVNYRHGCAGCIDKRWSECMRHGRGAGAEYFRLKLRKLKMMVR